MFTADELRKSTLTNRECEILEKYEGQIRFINAMGGKNITLYLNDEAQEAFHKAGFELSPELNPYGNCRSAPMFTGNTVVMWD